MSAAAVPWRLGATSYVVEDDLVGNARTLAGRVQDMQLVLFDLPGGPGNLPSRSAVAELAALGRTTGLGYTVHLLHDLAAVGVDDGWREALAWAHLVMARTRPLHPRAYVLHLDGRGVRGGTVDPAAWRAGIAQALTLAGHWAGGMLRLAVENLEGYAPDFVLPSVAQTGAGRCVDVGHLWLDGIDPLPWLAQARDKLAVVHLHGVQADAQGRRDHCALTATSAAQLDAVTAHLLATGFDGVLTLEVFGPADFAASMDALSASVARVAAHTGIGQPWASS